MEDCIFCKIISGEIPSAKVYEDDAVYVFLDITQVTPGHTLVIPKKHVRDIFSYDDKLASTLFERIPKIARAIQKAFPECKGLNIIQNNGEVAYQSVFHSHIHLIPRYSNNDGFSMSFKNNINTYNDTTFQARAQDIQKHI